MDINTQLSFFFLQILFTLGIQTSHAENSFRASTPRIMLSFLDLLHSLNPKLKKFLSRPYCQEAFFCVSSQRHSILTGGSAWNFTTLRDLIKNHLFPAQVQLPV